MHEPRAVSSFSGPCNTMHIYKYECSLFLSRFSFAYCFHPSSFRSLSFVRLVATVTIITSQRAHSYILYQCSSIDCVCTFYSFFHYVIYRSFYTIYTHTYAQKPFLSLLLSFFLHYLFHSLKTCIPNNVIPC